MLATALLLVATLLLPASAQAAQPEDTVSTTVCYSNTLLCVYFHDDAPVLSVTNVNTGGPAVAALTWIRLTFVPTGTFTEIPVTVNPTAKVCSAVSSTVLTCSEVGPRTYLYGTQPGTAIGCLVLTQMDVWVDGRTILGNVPMATVHTGASDC